MKLNQEKIQRMFNGQGSVAGGGGSSFDPSVLFGLATEQWTEENYVSKTFFNELFVIHKLTTTVVYDENDQEISRTTSKLGTFLPNELPSETETVDEETGYKTVVTTAVDNIEAKKGVWTNFFMSALGLNDSGGGGGVGDVTWDALEDDTDYRQIALSHLTTALQNYATQTWVQTQGYVTQSAISDMATKTWVGQQGFLTSSAISDMATKTWVGQQGFITSVTGTFWGRTFTNGGTVTGTLESVQHIQMTGHLYMHYGGTGIYLNSDGTGIDWHDANNDYVSSLLAFTSGQVQFNQDAYIPASKILRLGDAVFEWDATNNAVKVRKATGANDAVNFYATGGVSALGYGPSGGGGAGDVTWDLLADNTDTRQIAISHLTTALSGYATQNWVTGQSYATTSQLNSYLSRSGGTFTGSDAITIDNLGNFVLNQRSHTYWHIDTYDGEKVLVTTYDGYVGIGLTEPSYKLHVDGNVFASSFIKDGGTSSQFLKADGSVDSNSYALASSLGSYLPLTGGTLSGDLNINQSSSDGDLIILTSHDTYCCINFRFNSGSSISWSIGNGAPGDFYFWNSTNHSVVYIKESGDVGIGNSMPSYKLDVVGDVRATNFRGALIGNADTATSATTSSSCTGNSATATTLYTARTIWGQSFDGSANISGGLSGVSAIAFTSTGYFRIDSYGNFHATTNTDSNFWNVYNYAGVNSLSVLASSGYVGIGTTAPSERLEVNGNIKSNIIYANSSNSGISPIIQKNTGASGPLIFNGEASNLSDGSYTALLFGYADSNNNKGSLLFNKVGVGSTSNYIGIGFYGNDNILNITANKKVGIGTSSPLCKLSIEDTAGDLISLKSAATYSCINYFYSSGNGVGWSSGATDPGNYYLWNNYLTAICFTVNKSGSVGIGTTTPSEKLDVNGRVHISGSVYIDNVSSGNYDEGIRLANTKDNSYIGIIIGADPSSKTGTHPNQWQIARDSSNCFFWNCGGTVVARMLKDGKFGLGTTSPEQKLHVLGNILACGSSYTANGHYVQIGAIRLVYNDSTNSIRVVRYDGTAANLYATGGISALGISGSADGTVNASLIPSTTGTYELGSSTYLWKKIYLSNNSSNSYTGTISVDGDGINLISSNGGYFSGTRFLVNGRLVVNESDDVYPSYALYVNGNTYCDGSISASNVINRSDMRMKEVIDDLKLDLQTIANAPLFKFTFSKGERRVMVGTSAQYWQVLLPETVFTDADGMLGLDYGVTALASAISLAREVSEHDRRIAQLEAENMVLRAEIKNLKAA